MPRKKVIADMAIDILGFYHQDAVALKNIPESIKELEDKITSISASNSDTPVNNGGHNGTEDKLIEYLYKKDELMQSYRDAKSRFNRLQRALNTLSDMDRDILLTWYAENNNYRMTINKLCEKYNYEESQMNNLKSRAFNKLCCALYGR